MAQQNSTHEKMDFCSEILSPSELFAARSRSHKIPVRGQKEFLPDSSERQRERLKQSLEEHWSLLAEERVERRGNLVKAVWLPRENIAELQSPAGKFWQTMGFSARGKQRLHPEEALYLMECGNLQVFHRELPLSIQEAYERFLSSTTVSLQQYQVFSHLKRLGYVVNRCDIRSGTSHYEKQLNLPVSCDPGGGHAKRKRSPSPSSSITAVQQGSPSEERKESDDAERRDGRDQVEREEKREEERDDKTEERGEEEETEKKKEEEEEEEEEEGKPDAASQPRDITMATSPGTSGLAEGHRGRNWWAGEDPEEAGPHSHPTLNQPQPQPQPQPSSSSSSSAPPRWASISFPDLGSRRGLPSSLPSPEPCLLPGPLAVVGPCDVSPWLRRLNLRQVHLSRAEQKRETGRYRRDVNEDREVRRCRNWAEYQQLLTRRRGRSHRDRPAHLWEGKVTPLHDPRHPTSCGDLLDRISVIKPYRLTDGASREQVSGGWRLCFDVYQPDSVAEFRKSSPGEPYSRMCVCSFAGPVPDFRVWQQLTEQSGDVPVTFAVVDHGDISFYNFKPFLLTTDTAP